MEIIITMAGFGRRFLDAGYNVPKYRIGVHGRSLFSWSVISLRGFIATGARLTFVARADDRSADFIRSEASSLGVCAAEIVELDEPTDGQATTALLARGAIRDTHAPMLIYNIDTFVHPDALPAGALRGDGWIPCFRAEGDHWSFAAVGADGRVSEVREKKRISPNATIGLYGFSSFERYARAYGRHYADPANLERGERYVAPIYNTLIAEGGAVYVHDVSPSAVIPLGTPAEVDCFLAGPAPQV